jgi:hypothetical protein
MHIDEGFVDIARSLTDLGFQARIHGCKLGVLLDPFHSLEVEINGDDQVGASVFGVRGVVAGTVWNCTFPTRAEFIKFAKSTLQDLRCNDIEKRLKAAALE